MWKLKEFEYDPHTTDVGQLVETFIQDNEIKDFEVVGYNSSWSEEYENFANHLLIKYWDDK